MKPPAADRPLGRAVAAIAAILSRLAQRRKSPPKKPPKKAPQKKPPQKGPKNSEFIVFLLVLVIFEFVCMYVRFRNCTYFFHWPMSRQPKNNAVSVGWVMSRLAACPLEQAAGLGLPSLLLRPMCPLSGCTTYCHVAFK